MPADLAIPSKRVLAGRIAPLRSVSAKITSAPSSAAEMAALRPAAEAPATRISQFTDGGGTEDEIKVSRDGSDGEISRRRLNGELIEILTVQGKR